MWRFAQHRSKEGRNCERLLIFLNSSAKRLGPRLRTTIKGEAKSKPWWLPLVIDQSSSIYYYKYFTHRPFGATPDYPVLLDGWGCELSAQSYAVYFHCFLINTCWTKPTPRFCIDFRKVNAVTVSDYFPLPRMDDRAGTTVCIKKKLDLLKGYWQVPMTQRAADISAFVTPDAFMQYNVMAFGMQNAHATFQRLMWCGLGDVPNCSVDLHDVVVYFSDWESHMSSLKSVLQRIADASLMLTWPGTGTACGCKGRSRGVSTSCQHYAWA